MKVTKRGDKFTLTLDGLEALNVVCGLRSSAIDYERRANEARDRGETLESHYVRDLAREYWHMANILEAETEKGE